MAVVIETTIGDFTVDLYTNERPQTSRNFLKLCKLKYYNWNLFHSVQSNFIAQTGDPTGTGKGGQSVYGFVLGEEARYYEAEQMPKIRHNRVGLLSMVNCGNNMLGSQFIITLAPELQSLDGEHCVFGEIAEGLDIILKFNETICDSDYRPYQDIRISHTVILEDPFEDPKDLVIPDRSPEPTKEALMSDRIGADEVLDDTAGMSVEEITEMQKDKEAKARATILEIVGDIPDADMAPPENVLFVCKLNPVTSDDDLEIIFSRFGKIKSCEVIRDRQTCDSLQYAFIEFADRKSCEDAYFKMDNVLIDDRRIHVDFSQSVAKIKWRGKGKGVTYLDDKSREEINKSRGSTEPQTKKYNVESKRNEKAKNEGRERTGHKKHQYREEDKRNCNEYSESGKTVLSDKHKYRSTEGRSYEDKRDKNEKREKEGRTTEKSKDTNGSRSRARSRDRRSRDKTGYRIRSRSGDRMRDKNRSRSEDRVKDETSANNYNENHFGKDHKYNKRNSPRTKRKDNREFSSDEDKRYTKYKEECLSRKKKYDKDRSGGKYEQTEHSHKRKKR